MITAAQTIFLSSSVLFGLVAAVLLSIEVGYRIGMRTRSRHPEHKLRTHAILESSVFGLLALLIGFTFYGAGMRFEHRRDLIVKEANAIGTSYLRLDLLPPAIQPELREQYRNYLRSRLEIYEHIADIKALMTALDQSTRLQQQLWKNVVAASREAGPSEKTLLLSSLNESIDLTTDRTVALMTHPPTAIFGMLALTIVVSSALAGYTMADEGRDWFSTIVFALMLGISVCIILDYEFPRAGFIRIDPVDQVLVETLEKMK